MFGGKLQNYWSCLRVNHFLGDITDRQHCRFAMIGSRCWLITLDRCCCLNNSAPILLPLPLPLAIAMRQMPAVRLFIFRGQTVIVAYCRALRLVTINDTKSRPGSLLVVALSSLSLYLATCYLNRCEVEHASCIMSGYYDMKYDFHIKAEVSRHRTLLLKF